MLQWFLLTLLSIKSVFSMADPGILRVPKVYNAVITSNQNLAPSRAYPVIQPVVHKTAIGYVPPFYYTQLVPGPGVVALNPGESSRPEEAGSAENIDNPDSGRNSSPRKISRPSSKDKANEEFSDEETSKENSGKASSGTSGTEKKKNNNDDRVPLNFYPNYRSVYYDPYFNPYNAFPPNLATPGTYYVDYPQLPGILGPLPPPLPLQPGPGVFPIAPGNPDVSRNDGSNPDSSLRRNERQKSRGNERRDKIRKLPETRSSAASTDNS